MESKRTNKSPFERNPLETIFKNFSVFSKFLTETIPSINFLEEKNSYEFDLAIPGMNKDDFKIEIEADVVTVSTNKQKDTVSPISSTKEFDYSVCTRSFIVPKDGNINKIIAKYTDGILKITVPKMTEEEKSKTKINID